MVKGENQVYHRFDNDFHSDMFIKPPPPRYVRSSSEETMKNLLHFKQFELKLKELQHFLSHLKISQKYQTVPQVTYTTTTTTKPTTYLSQSTKYQTERE